MARVSRIKTFRIDIEIKFAPSRLSEEYLANAYELALPLVSRELDQKQQRKKRAGEGCQQMLLAAVNE